MPFFVVQYYTCVPHSIGRSKTAMQASVLTHESLVREVDVLRLMAAAQRQNTSSKNFLLLLSFLLSLIKQ